MAPAAGAPTKRSTILVASTLAGRQWEWHYVREALAAGAAAFATPPIRVYGSWLEDLWREADREQEGLVLTRSQSAALWRRVVAESPAGAQLIAHGGAAEWAAAAWALMHGWQVDQAALRAQPEQEDFRAFLEWSRQYRRTLRTRGWIDGAELEALLLRSLPRFQQTVLASDLHEPPPARAALFARLAECGARFVLQGVPEVAGTRRSTRLPDAAAELRTALAWAGERLREAPDGRVAVVVAGLAQRSGEVARAIAAELGSREDVWSAADVPAADPAIGAALSALALLAPSTGYAAFGRLLRSPFLADIAELSARAALDRELRAELRSQLPFLSAYRECGLRERLAERVPRTATCIERALAGARGAARAAPNRWAHVCSRFLADIEWQVPATQFAMRGWQSALDEVAHLTPILGDVTVEVALTELERILERPSPRVLPLSGIHVLPRIEDVGPGYSAVWVTGFTDAAWPVPAHGNPLVPLALQRAHGMPYSSPHDAERRCAALLARLASRVPDLVVSWPARVFDYETEPSPAIHGWEPLGAALARRTAPVEPPEYEIVADPAPPLEAELIPGGTGALGRQARCPLRAFCEDRLGARTIEAIGFGVNARLRGIATHRAAELLYEQSSTQVELVARVPQLARHSAERALSRLFARARAPLRALFELETEQLTAILEAFAECEANRTPYRVRAVEQKAELALGPWSLRVRIDRIDELADGSVAVIDYKTSARATGADWFASRLRDAQVPLYAAFASERVAAAVIARLTVRDGGYSGIWSNHGFPGRPSRGAAESMGEQITLWRAQLTTLAAEFAGGDTRIFLADYDEALADFAPLSRVYEQLALADTAAPSGSELP